MTPFVPASFSTWQAPQRWVNSSLPVAVSPPLLLQAVMTGTAVARATASQRRGFLSAGDPTGTGIIASSAAE